VEFSGDSAFVYMVKSEKPQEFERKHVKIGLSDGIRIEVTEGLKENDKIRGTEIIEDKKKYDHAYQNYYHRPVLQRFLLPATAQQKYTLLECI
jgi:hypothetical protein